MTSYEHQPRYSGQHHEHAAGLPQVGAGSVSAHSRPFVESSATTPQRPELTTRDFIEWDVRNWSTALDFWAHETAQELAGCSALEIGSRHGGLSLWLAHQGANVVCSDVGGPSRRAGMKHAAAGVSNRITYASVDATEIPYRNQFDIIVFKSVLGAVGGHQGKDAQAGAIRQMYDALKPGGELLFAENLIAAPIHRYLRDHFVSWSRAWRYVSTDEMREFLSPFAYFTYRTVGFAGAFGRTPRQRDFLGLLDRMLLTRMVPASWRYVMIGLARK